MIRLLIPALCAVGCAAAPPPEPRVVERVVYVEAPCPAPVVIEQHGHHAKNDGRHAKAKQRHAGANGDRIPRGHQHPGWSKKKHENASRCDEKPNAEARKRCKRKLARHSSNESRLR